MARLYIPSGSQDYGPIPGGQISETFGSNSAEKVKVAADGNVSFDASFVRGNDCIVVLGNSADYSVSGNLAGIILTSSNGAQIRIPSFAAGGGVKVSFNDVEVDFTTTDGSTFTIVGPDSSQTITGTSTGLTIGDGEVTPTPGDAIPLTVGADNLTGTSGDDTFEAIVSVNQNGEQTNQLQSGDILRGGSGFDTLDATVQDASALNGRPVAEIQLRTFGVEHLKINAEQANSSGDDDSVELDAERAYGVTNITSSFSDASLIVYNVNTLGAGGPSDPNNGLDNGRPTASIEICMDHTSGENVLYCASDMEVYFDADYLIPGEPDIGATTIRLQFMDIDNSLLNRPLKVNPYDLFIFVIDGVNHTLDVDQVSFPDLPAPAAYAALAAEINKAIAASSDPIFDGFSAALGQPYTIVDPETQVTVGGNEIIITDANGNQVDIVNFSSSTFIPGNLDFQQEQFINENDDTPDLITSYLCVEKVGSGGDGGDFIVGSMSTGGVEKFIVELKGYDAGTGGVNVDQDSSLASLASTNNVLREVYLVTEDDTTADIVIGNSVTDGVVPNMGYYDISWEDSVRYDDEYCGHLYPDGNPCDLTTSKNNALRDVQIFDATGLNSANDVTLWAHLSSEFTGKYLDLMDNAADPSADNVTAQYLFAGGNDTFNINIAKENFAFSGAATREDFAFYTDTGAGNDLVQVQIGDGMFGSYQDTNVGAADTVEELIALFSSTSYWYTNHLLNENLTIITGSGDDKVETWGSTAAYIELGTGHDIAFTDNSGGSENYGMNKSIDLDYGSDFNCCRATWVFNSQNAQVNDLLSFGRASITGVKDLAIVVQYMDFSVKVDIPGTKVGAGTTVTDLMINQAIKKAINDSTDATGVNKVLGDFLVAKDGPSGTLIVMSKVDGQTTLTDFTVTLAASSTTTAGSGRGFAALTSTELTTLGFAANGTPLTGSNGRWDTQYGLDDYKTLDGQDSVNVNNNRVYAGAGNDEVALSSNPFSIEHYVIKDESFGIDHVLNFTAAIADARVPAETELQEVCFVLDDDTTTDDVRILITLGDGTEVVTALIPADSDQATINAAVVSAINESGSGVEASINDDDCVELLYPTGVDYADADFQIVALTETQTFDFTGSQAGPATIALVFNGVPVGTITIDETDPTLTDAQIRDAVRDAINGLNNPLIDAENGTGGDGTGILQVNYYGDTNLGDGSGLVISPSVNVNITNITGPDNFEPADPGFTFEYQTLNDGSPELIPALGYDIFDVVDIIGVNPPEYFWNDQQDNSAGAEYQEVNLLVDSGKNGVLLIDTLDGGAGEFSYAAGTTTELSRLQQMVTAADADGAGQTGTDTSVIITVHDPVAGGDGLIGNFYKVVDAAGANNAQVTFLGTVYLGGYDAANKDPIGDWDAMTIANFTPLTPTELMTTYAGGVIV